MKWSFRITRIAGIDVYVHFTFLILLGWVVIGTLLESRDILATLETTGFLCALFGTVVLHELGHALAARRYGIQTRDIILLPIGGVARLERIPEKPSEELVVAIAGPLVNVALALVFLVLCAALGLPWTIEKEGLFEGSFAARMLWMNVVLVAFNLLPAFPMDGGRMLRALLAMRLEYARATRVAATIGQAMAMLFGFAGLMIGNPLLVIVALFVWMGAAQEAGLAQVRSALSGIPVSRAMIRDFRAVRPLDTLERVLQHILDGFQQDFPVEDGGAVVGILTRGDLLRAVAERGAGASVESVMARQFERASPSEPLDKALLRLEASPCQCLPVVAGEALVGILTRENLSEFLLIQEAVQRANQALVGAGRA